MSDLIFQPAPPAAGVAVEAIVRNDGWFPDVDPALVRRQIRLRDGVTAERLREAILGGIITIANDLDAWADAQRTAGYETLAAVPARAIDGETRLTILYRRALGCAIKADLVERYRDIDTTGTGQRQVSDLDQSVEELRRDMIHAIRDLLGTGRVTIDLI